MTFQICSGIHNPLRVSVLNLYPLQNLQTDKLKYG